MRWRFLETDDLYYRTRQANPSGSTDPSFASATAFSGDYREQSAKVYQEGHLVGYRDVVASHTDIPADAIIYPPGVDQTDTQLGKRIARKRHGKDLSKPGRGGRYIYELE